MSWLSSIFSSTPSKVTTIDGAAARKLHADGAVLLDVRTPQEFQGGSVPGAINVPLDRIQANDHTLKPEATYVVFCRSGARSANACKQLESQGFDKLHDMRSVTAW